MNNKNVFAIIIVTQIILTSCQTENFASEVSEPQTNVTIICEPPSQYLGNYVTGYTDYRRFDYEVMPAIYEWVEGRHIGVSTEYHHILPKYKTEVKHVSFPVGRCRTPEGHLLYQNCDENTKVATKEVTKQFLIQPQRIEMCEVPFLYKDGKTRIVVQPSNVKRILIPSH